MTHPPLWFQDSLMVLIFVTEFVLLWKFMIKPFCLCSKPHCWGAQTLHYEHGKRICRYHWEQNGKIDTFD